MERIPNQKSIETIHCPECMNFMRIRQTENGSYSVHCPVCRASVFSKQRSERERHIKIVKAQQSVN